MKRTAPRTCDAPGCTSTVRRGILMCRPHWFSLPKPLRDAISESWKAGRISEWSGHCLEARNFHRDGAAAATRRARPSITPQRSAQLIDRITGERN